MTNEEYKYELISKIVNNKTNKRRIAVLLGCSLRNINLMINRYDPMNKLCFKHKNSGKVPINKTDQGVVKEIIKLKRTKYIEFNVTHFCEKLNDVEGIKVKLVTLKRIFKAEKLISKIHINLLLNFTKKNL